MVEQRWYDAVAASVALPQEKQFTGKVSAPLPYADLSTGHTVPQLRDEKPRSRQALSAVCVTPGASLLQQRGTRPYVHWRHLCRQR